MVDVDRKTIYVYRFEENSVVDYKVFTNVDIAESSAFDGLKVSLQKVFSED